MTAICPPPDVIMAMPVPPNGFPEVPYHQAGQQVRMDFSDPSLIREQILDWIHNQEERCRSCHCDFETGVLVGSGPRRGAEKASTSCSSTPGHTYYPIRPDVRVNLPGGSQPLKYLEWLGCTCTALLVDPPVPKGIRAKDKDGLQSFLDSLPQKVKNDNPGWTWYSSFGLTFTPSQGQDQGLSSGNGAQDMMLAPDTSEPFVLYNQWDDYSSSSNAAANGQFPFAPDGLWGSGGFSGGYHGKGGFKRDVKSSKVQQDMGTGFPDEEKTRKVFRIKQTGSNPSPKRPVKFEWVPSGDKPYIPTAADETTDPAPPKSSTPSRISGLSLYPACPPIANLIPNDHKNTDGSLSHPSIFSLIKGESSDKSLSPNSRTAFSIVIFAQLTCLHCACDTTTGQIKPTESGPCSEQELAKFVKSADSTVEETVKSMCARWLGCSCYAGDSS